MTADVSISIVIPSKNEGAYLAATVDGLLAGLPADGELIVIDNGSTDGSVAAVRPDPRVSVVRVRAALGPACARNVGAELSRGRILLFSDAHVDVRPNWLEPMIAPLRRPEVGATGPVLCDMLVRESKGHGLRFCDSATSVEWLPRNGDEPYPVPALAGFFIVVRREVFAETGGFDEGMSVYGMEDPEFSLHVWALGYQCVLVPAVEVGHLYRHPLPDYQLDWETGLHNILRMGATHFGADRLAGMIRRHAADESFPAAAARLAVSDAGRRRSWLAQRRKHDDDWYFAHFGMD